jgi:hypothetical protein
MNASSEGHPKQRFCACLLTKEAVLVWCGGLAGLKAALVLIFAVCFRNRGAGIAFISHWGCVRANQFERIRPAAIISHCCAHTSKILFFHSLSPHFWLFFHPNFFPSKNWR